MISYTSTSASKEGSRHSLLLLGGIWHIFLEQIPLGKPKIRSKALNRTLYVLLVLEEAGVCSSATAAYTLAAYTPCPLLLVLLHTSLAPLVSAVLCSLPTSHMGPPVEPGPRGEWAMVMEPAGSAPPSSTTAYSLQVTSPGGGTPFLSFVLCVAFR